MKFEAKSLRSKFSQRIFGLFMLSALIPIITIFLISLNYISEQLDNETKRQIYQESRSLGLMLYDRLLSVESNLKIIANGLQRGMQPEMLENDTWLQTVFSGMYLQTGEGATTRFFGRPGRLDDLSTDDMEHLDSDRTLLQVVHKENQASNLYVILSIGNNLNDRSYLVGEINNEEFWDFGIYSPEFVCVLDNTGYAIYCSLADTKNDGKYQFKHLIESPDTDFSFILFLGQEYAVNIWNVFLKARYGADDLSIVMAVPRKTAFAAFNQFKAIFPQTLIATTLLVALLSISLIRKSLVPLEKLTEGTHRVSRGEFDRPVEIKSGDEFEKLATSFNEMTRRIDEQIKTTTTLAEIDRLILSSLDTDYIVETLIRHLHNVLKTDHVCVITLNDNDRTSGYLNINIDGEFSRIEKQKINLTDDEIVELEKCKSYILLNSKESRSYIKQQKVSGDRSFIVFPVHIKNTFSGMICLSAGHELDLDSGKLQQLRELSDRVAVALSNAAWEEKLYKQAHYDVLTELPNRYLFRDRFEQALEGAKRSNTSIALLFIDLDRFKSINDSMGHEYGDKVLAHIARVLSRCVRRNETLARFGGDEFLILLTNIKSEDVTAKVSKLSERIMKAMSKSFTIDSQEFYLTPSIGIAVYPHDADEFDSLLKNADSAMYNAKAAGRAKYKFYSREFNADAHVRLELENELRHALKKDEFELLYQPKINCQTARIIGVEALLRWRHPHKGLIPPDSFIQLAETAGLIADIGYWVLDTACNQNQAWQNNDRINLHMAVNLSPEQFRQPDLFERVYTIISNSGLRPDNLELEITESITIENFSKTITILNEFKELGVSISIDDFGTGYSSMTYLQQFPINRLKIDRTFISDIKDNSDSVSIIRAIIALAHSLNISVVAEGVETREQYESLKNLGCDEIQGYIISKPLTAVEFVRYYCENDGCIEHI